MKTKKIPTVSVLNLYSWAIAALGVLAGAFWIFFRADQRASLASGLLVMLASSLCSILIRVFGNLAQMTFEQGQKLEEVNQKLVQLDRLQEIRQRLDRLEEIKQKLAALDRLGEISQKLIVLDRLQETSPKLDQLEEIKQRLIALDQLEEIKQRLFSLDQLEEIKFKLVPPDQIERLSQTSEHISCDSKDISQGIHQIKEFFERIQKHLDLNK